MSFNTEFLKWLNSDVLTETERAELLSIKDNDEAKALRFSAPMDFIRTTLRRRFLTWVKKI